MKVEKNQITNLAEFCVLVAVLKNCSLLNIARSVVFQDMLIINLSPLNINAGKHFKKTATKMSALITVCFY